MENRAGPLRILALLASASLLCAAQAASAGEVRGTVYDAEGIPAANVELAIEGLALQAVSAADGSYSFPDVAAGEYRIAVGHGDSAVQYVRVKAADSASVKRNVFLLASEFVDETAANSLPIDAIIEQALDLADQMTTETAAREAAVWRWNDSEG